MHHAVLEKPRAGKPHKASFSYAAPQQGSAFLEDLLEQADELPVGMRAALARSQSNEAARTLEGGGEGMEWEQQ